MASPIDLIAALVLFLYVLLGMRTGLWSLLSRLVALVLGLGVALLWYQPLGAYITAHSSVTALMGSVLAFIGLMIVAQEIITFAFGFVIRKFPQVFFENEVTRLIAIIPGAIEGMILVGLFFAAAVLLPLPTTVSQQIAASATGTFVASNAAYVTGIIDKVSGGRVSKALSLITSGTEGEGSTPLPFKPSTTSVDEAGEQQLLELVNQERVSRGIAPLTMNTELVAVARAHSEDMWQRQYFAHVNPDGLSPFDRMHAADIQFMAAGENLALAPSVPAAHTGLMNSPGHKANILDPDFHTVGIGIIDGGIYGKMVTQDFTN